MSNGVSADATQVSSPVDGLSQIERVVDTFVAPSKTFTDIVRNTSWWLPFVLLLLATIASSYVVQKQVGFDRVYVNMVHDSPKTEDRINQMDPAQKARMLSTGETQVKFSSYGAFVFLLIFFALYALIVWASFNFGLGAHTTYAQVFAVTFYASLPYLLLSLLTIITLYAGGNAEAYDVRNPVGTNPAYYMADAAPWLRSILSSLDIVKIWSNVLMVIGMAIVARKTIAQSATIIGVLWLLGVALQTVTAAFS